MRILEIALFIIGMCNVDMQPSNAKSESVRSSSIGFVWTNRKGRLLPLRLNGGGRVGYDFYGKEARVIGSFENSTAISRIPEWDSAQVILRPKGHEDWLRITAHQKEVTAMIVVQFEGKEYLISADGFGAMLVWDTETWQCVRELAGHRFPSWPATLTHNNTSTRTSRPGGRLTCAPPLIVTAATTGRAAPRQPGRQVPRRVQGRRRHLQRRRRLRRLGVARPRRRGGLARLARRARRRRHVVRRGRAPQPQRLRLLARPQRPGPPLPSTPSSRDSLRPLPLLRLLRPVRGPSD
jgi:hypothetical protein